MRAVAARDLARSAPRADGTPVSVADLLAFLPGHQADHATQLDTPRDTARAAAPPTGRMTTVFLLMPRYTAPLERVDELLGDHVAWLDEHYAAGRFLASGRQVPRRGGVILADLPDRDAAEALTATDPFVRGGAAEYDVVEFVASKVAPGLERLAATEVPA